jgi:WD40 repeat protein/predicted Ser/Thr protein kinase
MEPRSGSTPNEPSEDAFYAFVAAYYDALAKGQPPPSEEQLSHSQRQRWQQLCQTVELLHLHSSLRPLPKTLSQEPTKSIDSIRKSQTVHAANQTQVGLVIPGQTGQFIRIRELGRGGMGVVFLARDIRLDRLVAIKELSYSQSFDEHSFQRFQSECRVMARQQHPNIVQVYEAGELEGIPYLVMEYVVGQDLKKHIDGKPLAPTEAARLLAQLADAMDHAHQNGVIHRDLKPTNVLIGQDSTPKITDFGLALLIDTNTRLTRSNEVVGTPNYLAPESIIAPQSVGPAIDVYGLGAILYECLTARPPFLNGNVGFMLTQVLHHEPVEPRRLNPSVPKDLERICLKCLDKNPARRYASAKALADDLRRFLNHQPIHARPISPLTRLGKWARRNPALAVGLTLIWLMLVAGLVLVLRHNVELQAERDYAIEQEQQTTIARNEADLRTQDAIEARKLAEDRLVDLYETLGHSTADQNPALAALWYAVAAYHCTADPQRRQHNRIRWLSATRLSPLPWAVVSVNAFSDVSTLDLHPSGRWLITNSPKHCWLYDLVVERAIPWSQVNEDVLAASFSLDGRWLALALRDRTVELRSFPQQAIRGRWPVAIGTSTLAFSPSGRLLAFGMKQLTVVDTQTGQLACRPLDLPQAMLAANFSPDEKRLLVAHDDRHARCYQLLAPDQPPKLLDGAIPMSQLPVPLQRNGWPAFLGGKAASRVPEGVLLWNIDQKQPEQLIRTSSPAKPVFNAYSRQPELICPNPIDRSQRYNQAAKEIASRDELPRANLAAYSPDGSMLLLGDDEGVQLRRCNETRVWPTLWHNRRLQQLACGPEGKHFVTTGLHHARLWLVPDGYARGYWPPRDDSVSPAVICTLGQTDLLVRLSRDERKTLTAVDTRTGQTRDWRWTLPAPAESVCASPDGSVVYAVIRKAQAGQLLAFDIRSQQPYFAPVELPIEPCEIACSPDGKCLVLLARDTRVQIHSAQTGQVQHTLPRQRANQLEAYEICFPPQRIVFAPDSQTFLILTHSPRLRLWETASGRSPRQPLPSLDNQHINNASFSPDGRYLLLCSFGSRRLEIIDTQTGARVGQPIEHPDTLFCARFDPTGQRIVTSCRDGLVRVYDRISQKQLIEPLVHQGEVCSAVFSPNGRWLATADSTGAVRLWRSDTGAPMTPRIPLDVPDKKIYYFAHACRFTADGQALIVHKRCRNLHVLDTSWLDRPVEPQLSDQDLIDLAEINSGWGLVNQRKAVPLDEAGWLQRWERFRQRVPTYHRPAGATGWPTP